MLKLYNIILVLANYAFLCFSCCYWNESISVVNFPFDWITVATVTYLLIARKNKCFNGLGQIELARATMERLIFIAARWKYSTAPRLPKNHKKQAVEHDKIDAVKVRYQCEHRQQALHTKNTSSCLKGTEKETIYN